MPWRYAKVKSVSKITALVVTGLIGGTTWLRGEILPPIQTATIDQRGRIEVNGKPFFPILLYDVPTDPESLKLFREYGFNTLVISKPEEADTLRAQGLYAVIHAGVKSAKYDGVLMVAGIDSPALCFKDDLLTKVRADLAGIHAAVPGRPVMNAIGYWLDEPAGVISNRVPPKAKYEDLIQVLEVAAPYLYPVPYQPVRSVGEAVGRAQAATGGRNPVVPILQLFVWDAKDRYPTPAELKCMVYLALIHGAKGIGYYSYAGVTGKKGTTIAKEQPALWQAVRSINKEAMAAADALLADSETDRSVAMVEKTPEIEMRAVKAGKTGLILLANTGAAARSVTLQLDPATVNTLRRLDGGNDIALQNGKVTLQLGSYEATGLTWP